MFHFIVPLHGHFFTFQDPRDKKGFKGQVEEGVSFQPLPEGANDWKDGHERPQVGCLGVSPHDPKQYRLFGSKEECRDEGFSFLSGNVTILDEWNPAEK